MSQTVSQQDLSSASRADESKTVTRLLRALRTRFGERADGQEPSAASGDAHVARAPGRVNLLGGHTDYSGGFVLPATIDRAVHVALRRRADRQVRLYSLNFEEEAEYVLGDADVAALPGWARYVAGVVREIQQQVPARALAGFEAVVYGDVPLGAGLSSSAALEVATAVGVDALFELALDPVQTAELCQRAEQQHVGVECGIMDQFASRLGRADCALFLDCRSLEHEHVPLPLEEEACLVVTDSGVRRELAASKYNERRRECEAAAQFFRAFDETIETLRDVSGALLEKHGAALAEEHGASLLHRARHVVRENQRVERGAELLADGRLDAFGDLMNASHASLAGDYEVSCDELDLLARLAQETDGVLGARMTGAGFGGCTVTLARRAALPELKRKTQRHYTEHLEVTPEMYVVEHNLEAKVL